ncbi:hypothetical protein FGG08_003701 [Glutinoglossum americanum]|uniref:Uncharacterized protein n=1 Tax=Glutinoglossum americanum TaxID=1670608 RepID=A0A9P8IAH6_9PEZI|nr:hypothetical protein FGG08_003701 [Glutinoglossum americanum]
MPTSRPSVVKRYPNIIRISEKKQPAPLMAGSPSTDYYFCDLDGVGWSFPFLNPEEDLGAGLHDAGFTRAGLFAADQIPDWEDLLNLDEDQSSPLPSVEVPGPVSTQDTMPQIVGYRHHGKEIPSRADLGQGCEVGLSGSRGGIVRSTPPLAPPRKRKIATIQDGISGGTGSGQDSGEGSNGVSESKKRISKKAKTTLMSWLEENRQDPYPDKREIEKLSALAGLELAKVKNWLNNARQRHLPKLISAASNDSEGVKFTRSRNPNLGDGSHQVRLSPVPVFPELGIAQDQTHHNMDLRYRQLSPPMERFLSSPPESEAALLSAIKATAIGTEFQFTQATRMNPTEESQIDTNYDSISVSGSTESAASNISYSSQSSQYPRKGRKLAHTKTARHRPLEKRFQCTFCGVGFLTSYDWRRHEESQHFPQQEWICMWDGPRVREDEQLVCVFCGTADTSDYHMASAHNALDCYHKEIPERTFTRKDHLIQHVRQVHKAKGESPHMRGWSRPIRYDCSWACGFCEMRFGDWQARVRHIDKHFAEKHKVESSTRQFLRAAERGDVDRVRQLLNRPEVDQNCYGFARLLNNRIPLSLAAMNGHEVVVGLLLAREDARPNSEDIFGNNSLFLAAMSGHEAVVRLLLARDDVKPNSKNKLGQTPLLIASKNGHEAVVRLLLARDDIEPNLGDGLGNSPLLLAFKNGHQAVAQLLLAREDVTLNPCNDSLETPWSPAMEDWHEVIRLLLAREDLITSQLCYRFARS